MSVKRCNDGHFYDDEQFSSCPYCNKSETIANEIAGLVNSDYSEVRNALTIMDEISSERELAKQLTQHYLEEVEDNDKTIGMFFDAENIQPVVGWLVCENGPERGSSYKIIAGRNFVGRSHKSDIVIYDDPEISRENHCSVVFEPKTCNFYIMSSDHAVTMINNEVLTDAICITEDDVISIGKSKFRMIAYCKKGREWN